MESNLKIAEKLKEKSSYNLPKSQKELKEAQEFYETTLKNFYYYKGVIEGLNENSNNSQPNLASYLETYYEVVAAFYSYPQSLVIQQIENEQGRTGLYQFARELADEFEKINEGRFWDGEFFDEIDEFLKNKLQ